ncbi:MAG: Crp/Fnr family transcriptional regulator [Roseiflexaceae bacterium]
MRRKHQQGIESAGDWERLANGRAVESAPRGTIFYRPEQPAEELLLLRSGQVALYLLSDEGRTLTLRVVEPGQIFGHVAIADGGSYNKFAEALTPVRFSRVARAELRRLIEQDSGLALQLLEDLGQHRLAISRRLDEVAFKSVPARLASLLLDMAKHEGGAQTTRVQRRSHRQLAEMINAYRETVTKVIKQFRAARLLEVDRSTITLLNRPGLEELAQG